MWGLLRLRRFALHLALAVMSSDLAGAQPTAADVPAYSPTYPTGLRPPIFANEGILPSAELIGFDLRQDDVTVEGPKPSLAIGTPLKVILYWKPVSERFGERKVRIQIRGPGVGQAPGFYKSYDMDVGPWAFGGVYEQECELPITQRQLVGSGTLTIAERSTEDGWWHEQAMLYAMPVQVPATTWESVLDDQRVKGWFGDDCVRLRRAFRLGPGTSVNVPVTMFTQETPSALGLVSYLSWDTSFEQGEAVCRVELVNERSGEAETAYIRAGVSTAVHQHDRYEPGEIKTQKIATAYAQDNAPGEDGRVTQRRHYLGFVTLETGIRPSRITFTYLRDAGMFDVEAVVLTPAKEK